MSEAMTDERLAKLRAENEPVGDHTSSLTADEVAELFDEIDRLRKQSAELETLRAELGETHDEWRAEQPSGAPNLSYAIPTEEVARVVVVATRELGHKVTLQRRVVGEWREVEGGDDA